MKTNIEKKAFEFCTANKERLTLPRQLVLKIIARNKKPLKAYDLIDKLRSRLVNIKPPTVYRALDFWQKHNFIHRIESLNAFCICSVDQLHKGAQFIICNSCGEVVESDSCNLPKIIDEFLKKNTFKPLKWNIEINGICQDCI